LNSPVIVTSKVKQITQAQAARIHADQCAFFNCAFLGVQDTLYDDYGRHYYHNCYIQGGIDFKYGSGQSLFEVK
jgi:pectinesterase